MSLSLDFKFYFRIVEILGERNARFNVELSLYRLQLVQTFGIWG